MRLSPSSAGIWGSCPGAIKMCAGVPDTSGPDAAEGTAAHEVAHKMIDGLQRGAAPLPGCYVGTTASNGTRIDEEIYEAAEIYAQDVGAVMQSTRIFGGPSLAIEGRLRIPDIHPECEGTPDCRLYNFPAGHLWLWDFKYGHGVVEPFENPQLVGYLSGFCSSIGVNGANDQKIHVHARIVQPRAFHRDGAIREWSCMLSDIRPHVNRLKAAAEEALGPAPRIVSGPQCRYCPARAGCSAAIGGGMALYEAAGQAIPATLTAPAIGALFALVKRARGQLEYIEGAIEEQIKSRIRGGENIPGCLVEEGVGREAWAKPEAEIVALGDMMGIDVRRAGVVTPAQAKKKGIDPEIVAAYTERPSTGFKVVVDNNLKARSVFK